MQHTILYSQTVIDIFEHTLKYSNQPKQIYLTYSWFRFIKQHIYIYILIPKRGAEAGSGGLIVRSGDSGVDRVVVNI
jgi:hypothetical protein